MNIELEAMAIEVPEVEGHPNRDAFQGVLTLVDVASDRPPQGSDGHRVVLTKKAAEEALPSLLGMALDYAPTLDRHDVRRKVGVITSAEIVGRTLELKGFLYGHDFPEIVREIERRGRKPGPYGSAGELGMSYEVTETNVVDKKAAVWILTRVVFTGAAILKRDKAAYGKTWIEMESDRL